VKLTADTITDEQIRELAAANEAVGARSLAIATDCMQALTPDGAHLLPLYTVDDYAQLKRAARARCAEILNARGTKP
jgi:hypothetical protein